MLISASHTFKCTYPHTHKHTAILIAHSTGLSGLAVSVKFHGITANGIAIHL